MSVWAATIDLLSYQEDVLFVQAAGNLRDRGAPANPGILDHLQQIAHIPITSTSWAADWPTLPKVSKPSQSGPSRPLFSRMLTGTRCPQPETLVLFQNRFLACGKALNRKSSSLGAMT